MMFKKSILRIFCVIVVGSMSCSLGAMQQNILAKTASKQSKLLRLCNPLQSWRYYKQWYSKRPIPTLVGTGLAVAAGLGITYWYAKKLLKPFDNQLGYKDKDLQESFYARDFLDQKNLDPKNLAVKKFLNDIKDYKFDEVAINKIFESIDKDCAKKLLLSKHIIDYDGNKLTVYDYLITHHCVKNNKGDIGMSKHMHDILRTLAIGLHLIVQSPTEENKSTVQKEENQSKFTFKPLQCYNIIISDDEKEYLAQKKLSNENIVDQAFLDYVQMNDKQSPGVAFFENLIKRGWKYKPQSGPAEQTPLYRIITNTNEENILFQRYIQLWQDNGFDINTEYTSNGKKTTLLGALALHNVSSKKLGALIRMGADAKKAHLLLTMFASEDYTLQDIKDIEAASKQDFDWNIQDEQNNTLLMKACTTGQLDKINYLLDHGANNVLAINNDKQTLLHIIAQSWDKHYQPKNDLEGQKRLIERLFKMGSLSSLNALNLDNKKPLNYVSKNSDFTRIVQEIQQELQQTKIKEFLEKFKKDHITTYGYKSLMLGEKDFNQLSAYLSASSIAQLNKENKELLSNIVIQCLDQMSDFSILFIDHTSKDDLEAVQKLIDIPKEKILKLAFNDFCLTTNVCVFRFNFGLDWIKKLIALGWDPQGDTVDIYNDTNPIEMIKRSRNYNLLSSKTMILQYLMDLGAGFSIALSLEKNDIKSFSRGILGWPSIGGELSNPFKIYPKNKREPFEAINHYICSDTIKNLTEEELDSFKKALNQCISKEKTIVQRIINETSAEEFAAWKKYAETDILEEAFAQFLSMAMNRPGAEFLDKLVALGWKPNPTNVLILETPAYKIITSYQIHKVTDYIQCLQKHGLDINHSYNNAYAKQETLLNTIVSLPENKSKIQELLKLGADPNKTSMLDLMFSSKDDYPLDYIKDVLATSLPKDMKFDLSKTDSDGNTLLMLACQKGQLDKINYLLDNGVKASLTNKKYRGPLHIMAQQWSSDWWYPESLRKEQEAVINRLVKAGAYYGADAENKTPFNYAGLNSDFAAILKKCIKNFQPNNFQNNSVPDLKLFYNN